MTQEKPSTKQFDKDVSASFQGLDFRKVVGQVGIGFGAVCLLTSVICCIVTCCCPLVPALQDNKETVS